MFGLGTKLRRKRREQSRKDKNKTILTSVTEAGTVMAVPVDTATATRYLEMHDIIPDSLPAWPEAELDDLVSDVDFDDPLSCERAMILLAHHKSPHAAALLQELLALLDDDLAGFGELAYAEAIGWLGYNYVRSGDAPPSIEPASMMAVG